MGCVWDNKSDMDGKEIFSNEKSISQIVSYGEAFLRNRKIKLKE